MSVSMHTYCAMVLILMGKSEFIYLDLVHTLMLKKIDVTKLFILIQNINLFSFRTIATF